MICRYCDGLVEWVGPLANLHSTQCRKCGAVDSAVELAQGQDEPFICPLTGHPLTQEELEQMADKSWIPTVCDFCGETRSPEEMEPEEADMWACHTCMRRWDEEDRKRGEA